MNKIVICIVSFTMWSCGVLEELPIFDHPMPESATVVNSIDEKFDGVYESLTDSAYLIIDAGSIIIRDFYNGNVRPMDADSLRHRIADIQVSDQTTSREVTVQSDTVIQRRFVSDTLFSKSENYQLKKYRGFYFANKKTVSSRWTVRTLRMTRYGILVSRLRSREELESIEDYSLVEPDSLTPKKQSKSDLKLFLQSENYPDERRFVRIGVRSVAE